MDPSSERSEMIPYCLGKVTLACGDQMCGEVVNADMVSSLQKM